VVELLCAGMIQKIEKKNYILHHDICRTTYELSSRKKETFAAASSSSVVELLYAGMIHKILKNDMLHHAICRKTHELSSRRKRHAIGRKTAKPTFSMRESNRKIKIRSARALNAKL